MATYNVNWGNSSYRELARTLKRSGAAVIALQESSPRLEQYLRVQLYRDFPYQHYTGFQDRFLGERFGILSKVPFKSMRFQPPRHGLFGFLVAEFSWEGQNVKLINVHLQPFDVTPGVSVFRQLDVIEEVHQAEIEDVLHYVKADQPTLIVGDFNSPSAFAAPKQVRKQGFEDSFASKHETLAEADKHPTWHWPVGNTELSLRIDYIFHDPHWKMRDSRLAAFEFSDHRMLISTLELTDQGPDEKTNQ